MSEVLFAGGLFAQYFAPAGKDVKGGVVISTGIHQHSAMYEGFANRLSSEGFAVLAYDHRGFGRSESYNGWERSQVPNMLDLGAVAETEHSLVADLQTAIELLRGKCVGSCKIFAFGHSLGGLACVGLATSGSGTADGYILSNPTVLGRNVAEEGSLEFELKAKRGRTKDCTWDDPRTAESLAWKDNDEIIGNGETGPMSTANPRNPLFWETWVTTWSENVERGKDGKLMPFKADYMRKAIEAIIFVRSHFRDFVGDTLVLRGGKDPFEGGGTTDLCIAILEASSLDKTSSLTFQSYPDSGHDVIFEECAPGTLSMDVGTNRAADDIVHWLHARAAQM